jgi:hypothetical protein
MPNSVLPPKIIPYFLLDRRYTYPVPMGLRWAALAKSVGERRGLDGNAFGWASVLVCTNQEATLTVLRGGVPDRGDLVSKGSDRDRPRAIASDPCPRRVMPFEPSTPSFPERPGTRPASDPAFVIQVPGPSPCTDCPDISQ